MFLFSCPTLFLYRFSLSFVSLGFSLGVDCDVILKHRMVMTWVYEVMLSAFWTLVFLSAWSDQQQEKLSPADIRRTWRPIVGFVKTSSTRRAQSISNSPIVIFEKFLFSIDVKWKRKTVVQDRVQTRRRTRNPKWLFDWVWCRCRCGTKFCARKHVRQWSHCVTQKN